jgi:signal transduction histidine kinase
MISEHNEDTGDKSAAIEKELSEFSYIVSHDLAASCRHLSQFSQLLLRNLGDLTDPQRSYANHIRAAGEKCQMMMEQLLLFSRIQQRELKHELRDATLLAEAAFLQLSHQVREADAIISIEPLGSVYGDPELLTLMFRELMDNAIKFRSPDRPCRVQVRAAQEGDQWIARITDNGIGLAGEQQEKAFRMFWQLNGEKTSGVGAGLAICRRIARRHNGEVRFASTNEGTRAEIVLPSAQRVN